MQQLIGEPKIQATPSTISAPTENIYSLSNRKVTNTKAPEVFGFPSLSKHINDSLFLGGGVVAISPNKLDFGSFNILSDGMDTLQKSRSRMMNTSKTEMGQVSHQTVKQRGEPKSGNMFSLKYDLALKSDTKSESKTDSIYSLKLDTKMGSGSILEEKYDTRIKARKRYVPRPKPEPKRKPKPKPKIAGKKTKTSDDIYGDLMKSIDISVINPRIALKDIL